MPRRATLAAGLLASALALAVAVDLPTMLLADASVEKPSARYGAGMTTVGLQEVLVAGGRTASALLNDAFVYTGTNNQWRKTVNLPVATAGASLSQVGSRLILVGGERATGLPSAEAYTAANADAPWSPATVVGVAAEGGMTPRAYHCAVTLPSTPTSDAPALLVFGGMLEDGSGADDTWLLEEHTGAASPGGLSYRWRKPYTANAGGAAGTQPPARYMHSCVLRDSKVYVVGGRSSAWTAADSAVRGSPVWMLDLATYRWSSMTVDTPTRALRYGHVAAMHFNGAYGTSMFLWGGSGAAPASDVAAFALAPVSVDVVAGAAGGNAPTDVGYSLVDAMQPWNTTSIQGRFLASTTYLDGVLLVFGGAGLTSNPSRILDAASLAAAGGAAAGIPAATGVRTTDVLYNDMYAILLPDLRSDCVVSNWSAWSECAATGRDGGRCADNMRTRTRTIVKEASGPGTTACPTDLVQSLPCGQRPCSADGAGAAVALPVTSTRPLDQLTGLAVLSADTYSPASLLLSAGTLTVHADSETPMGWFGSNITILVQVPLPTNGSTAPAVNPADAAYNTTHTAVLITDAVSGSEVWALTSQGTGRDAASSVAVFPPTAIPTDSVAAAAAAASTPRRIAVSMAWDGELSIYNTADVTMATWLDAEPSQGDSDMAVLALSADVSNPATAPTVALRWRRLLQGPGVEQVTASAYSDDGSQLMVAGTFNGAWMTVFGCSQLLNHSLYVSGGATTGLPAQGFLLALDANTGTCSWLLPLNASDAVRPSALAVASGGVYVVGAVSATALQLSAGSGAGAIVATVRLHNMTNATYAADVMHGFVVLVSSAGAVQAVQLLEAAPTAVGAPAGSGSTVALRAALAITNTSSRVTRLHLAGELKGTMAWEAGLSATNVTLTAASSRSDGLLLAVDTAAGSLLPAVVAWSQLVDGGQGGASIRQLAATSSGSRGGANATLLYAAGRHGGDRLVVLPNATAAVTGTSIAPRYGAFMMTLVATQNGSAVTWTRSVSPQAGGSGNVEPTGLAASARSVWAASSLRSSETASVRAGDGSSLYTVTGTEAALPSLKSAYDPFITAWTSFEPSLAVDCVVSSWSSWTACPSACNAYATNCTRTVAVQPAGAGAQCPPLFDQAYNCGSQPCSGSVAWSTTPGAAAVSAVSAAVNVSDSSIIVQTLCTDMAVYGSQVFVAIGTYVQRVVGATVYAAGVNISSWTLPASYTAAPTAKWTQQYSFGTAMSNVWWSVLPVQPAAVGADPRLLLVGSLNATATSSTGALAALPAAPQPQSAGKSDALAVVTDTVGKATISIQVGPLSSSAPSWGAAVASANPAGAASLDGGRTAVLATSYTASLWITLNGSNALVPGAPFTAISSPTSAAAVVGFHTATAAVQWVLAAVASPASSGSVSTWCSHAASDHNATAAVVGGHLQANSSDRSAVQWQVYRPVDPAAWLADPVTNAPTATAANGTGTSLTPSAGGADVWLTSINAVDASIRWSLVLPGSPSAALRLLSLSYAAVPGRMVPVTREFLINATDPTEGSYNVTEWLYVEGAQTVAAAISYAAGITLLGKTLPAPAAAGQRYTAIFVLDAATGALLNYTTITATASGGASGGSVDVETVRVGADGMLVASGSFTTGDVCIGASCSSGAGTLVRDALPRPGSTAATDDAEGFVGVWLLGAATANYYGPALADGAALTAVTVQGSGQQIVRSAAVLRHADGNASVLAVGAFTGALDAAPMVQGMGALSAVSPAAGADMDGLAIQLYLPLPALLGSPPPPPGCHASCGTCSGPSTTQCLSCAPASGTYLSNGTCVTACPAGTYSRTDTGTCEVCSTGCASCTGPTAAECTRCSPAAAAPYHLVNRCVSNCTAVDIGYFSCTSAGTCASFPLLNCNCHPTCNTCSGPAASQCLTCPVGYYYTPLTGGCTPGWSCVGPTAFLNVTESLCLQCAVGDVWSAATGGCIAGPTPTPSPTASPTATASVTPSMSFGATFDPTASPSSSASVTASASVSPLPADFFSNCTLSDWSDWTACMPACMADRRTAASTRIRLVLAPAGAGGYCPPVDSRERLETRPCVCPTPSRTPLPPPVSTCFNGRIDGDESDTDCGGVQGCTRCLVGRRCRQTLDCGTAPAFDTGNLTVNSTSLAADAMAGYMGAPILCAADTLKCTDVRLSEMAYANSSVPPPVQVEVKFALSNIPQQALAGAAANDMLQAVRAAVFAIAIQSGISVAPDDVVVLGLQAPLVMPSASPTASPSGSTLPAARCASLNATVDNVTGLIVYSRCDEVTGVCVPVPTCVPEPSASSTASVSTSASASVTGTPTPSISASSSVTGTPSGTPSISASASITGTPTPTISETPTTTPSAPAASASPSASATSTPSTNATETPSTTPSPTASVSANSTNSTGERLLHGEAAAAAAAAAEAYDRDLAADTVEALRLLSAAAAASPRHATSSASPSFVAALRGRDGGSKYWLGGSVSGYGYGHGRGLQSSPERPPVDINITVRMLLPANTDTTATLNTLNAASAVMLQRVAAAVSAIVNQTVTVTLAAPPAVGALLPTIVEALPPAPASGGGDGGGGGGGAGAAVAIIFILLIVGGLVVPAVMVRKNGHFMGRTWGPLATLGGKLPLPPAAAEKQRLFLEQRASKAVVSPLAGAGISGMLRGKKKPLGSKAAGPIVIEGDDEEDGSISGSGSNVVQNPIGAAKAAASAAALEAMMAGKAGTVGVSSASAEVAVDLSTSAGAGSKGGNTAIAFNPLRVASDTGAPLPPPAAPAPPAPVVPVVPVDLEHNPAVVVNPMRGGLPPPAALLPPPAPGAPPAAPDTSAVRIQSVFRGYKQRRISAYLKEQKREEEEAARLAASGVKRKGGFLGFAGAAASPPPAPQPAPAAGGYDDDEDDGDDNWGAESDGGWGDSDEEEQEEEAPYRPPKEYANDEEAAEAIQKVYKAWKVRQHLAGWVKVIDDDGDVFFRNESTDELEWVLPPIPFQPPSEEEEGEGEGEGEGKEEEEAEEEADEPYEVDDDGNVYYLDGPGGRRLALGWRRCEDGEDVWYVNEEGDSSWEPEYADD